MRSGEHVKLAIQLRKEKTRKWRKIRLDLETRTKKVRAVGGEGGDVAASIFLPSETADQ